ncbi:MAG: hypothetical protein H2174_00675 [Vampirovibrio sp.]|nr:hypothetical protein [Vampirovibrio sp.]
MVRLSNQNPLAPEITQTHYDVFTRKGYEGISPELETKLTQLGVSYKLHPAPEEKTISSTMIRGLLSNWIKNPKDFKAFSALEEIYQGAPKALDFLIKHALDFTKLVKR